ncbi:MAG: molybdate ABC transporter substrate-binding protein [Thermoanaerobaculia bacterium]
MRPVPRSALGLALTLAALWGGPRGVRAAPAPRPADEAAGVELMVYAAASLREALEELASACQREEGVRVLFNFGASNDLARQIRAANKADVFLSADEAWMDAVAAAGLVDAPSRRTLLSNRLVVIGARGSGRRVGSAAELAALPVARLSLANPEAVPAGKYARAWLERAGQWDAVEERVVPAVDVRAALAAVETGAIEVGIVYATDAAISDRVEILLAVPETEAPLIRYPIAALAERPHLQAARRVVDWLAGEEAAAVFESYGFGVLAPVPEPVVER